MVACTGIDMRPTMLGPYKVVLFCQTSVKLALSRLLPSILGAVTPSLISF